MFVLFVFLIHTTDVALCTDHQKTVTVSLRAYTYEKVEKINTQYLQIGIEISNMSKYTIIDHFKNDVSAILFFSPVQVGEDITHQEQFIHNVSHSIPLTH